MTLVTQVITIDKNTAGDNIVHVVCMCSPDIAFCGKNVKDRPWNDDAETSCVVCADLEWHECSRCGF